MLSICNTCWLIAKFTAFGGNRKLTRGISYIVIILSPIDIASMLFFLHIRVSASKSVSVIEFRNAIHRADIEAPEGQARGCLRVRTIFSRPRDADNSCQTIRHAWESVVPTDEMNVRSVSSSCRRI